MSVDRLLDGLVVGGVIGAVAWLAWRVSRPVKRKATPGKRAYIEKADHGRYIARNIENDLELGMRNSSAPKGYVLLAFVTPEEAIATLEKDGWVVEGIVGDVECVKTSVGEM